MSMTHDLKSKSESYEGGAISVRALTPTVVETVQQSSTRDVEKGKETAARTKVKGAAKGAAKEVAKTATQKQVRKAGKKKEIGAYDEDIEKSGNASWTDDMTTTLVRKMLNMKRAGRQSNNGWKKSAWSEACKTLNKGYGLSFTTDKLKNKMNSV
ncbi:hypothetical protein FN846DRAFT_1004764 [Sphaerosporella brunnea]|uniref:Myb/SANT-like domain-containing protein n=1 Tax=Sphaerosporella brunnea TaxID=1250544 RepID=A0A5J5EER3_9PEZI|nr:hypothetical protein FN846DRAFT_1004764 [Sphaerosporella brunnea]